MPVSSRDGVVVFKRLDHGSSHPTKPLRALAGTPSGRDDTLFSPGVFVLGLDGRILDACPYILLIRDNSCNSWTF